jgi:cytidylate kinase
MDRIFSELVEGACRRWEAQAEAAARGKVHPGFARPLSIAISREAGTPGSSVAQGVGELLGWQVYDRELLELIAKEMGLRSVLLESVDERQQTWLRESIQSGLASLAAGSAAPWASESSFVHHLVETVLALGIHGECVIVGRGATFILPAETTLRVRLVAPVADRIEMLRHRLGLSQRQAAQRVRTIERQRNDFARDHFQRDPTEPDNFDLMLNASRFSIEEAAETIVEALRRLRQHTPVSHEPADAAR